MDCLSSDFEKRTRRLIIRPYKSSDYKVWKEAFLNLPDSKTAFDVSGGFKKSKDQVGKKKFNNILKQQKNLRNEHELYNLAVFEKKSGKLIGFVSITGVVRWAWQKAELGYFVFNQFWKMGYGKEMTKAAIEIAFKNLKLHRLEAGIFKKNIPSKNLAKSIGMKFEGIRKKYVYAGKKRHDLEIYYITPGDIGLKTTKPSIQAESPFNL